MEHDNILVFQIPYELRGAVIELAARHPSATSYVTANVIGIAYVDYSEVVGERGRCVGLEKRFGEVFARNVGKVAEGYIGHCEVGEAGWVIGLLGCLVGIETKGIHATRVFMQKSKFGVT